MIKHGKTTCWQGNVSKFLKSNTYSRLRHYLQNSGVLICLLISGNVIAGEDISMIKDPSHWQGNVKGQEINDQQGSKSMEFQLRASEGTYKFRCIIYQVLNNPDPGKYEFSFKFRMEDPNMKLIPSCRLFNTDNTSRFVYNQLKDKEYPEEGGWVHVVKTFDIPENTPKAFFVLEARNNSDSRFQVSNAKVIYKGN